MLFLVGATDQILLKALNFMIDKWREADDVQEVRDVIVLMRVFFISLYGVLLCTFTLKASFLWLIKLLQFDWLMLVEVNPY